MEGINLQYVIKGEDIIITPKGKPHTETLIFLHGLGDTAKGWHDLFYSKMSPLRDTTKVVLLTAPIAPVTINLGMSMNSWYDIRTFDKDEKNFAKSHGVDEIKKNSIRIKEVLEQEIKELGNDSKKVFIGGFSQGCSMALHVGLSFNKPLGGFFALSGYIFPITEVNKENMLTPIFISHGNDDPLIPIKSSQESYKKLMVEGRKVSTLWVPHLGHGIDYAVIEGFKKFFASIVA